MSSAEVKNDLKCESNCKWTLSHCCYAAIENPDLIFGDSRTCVSGSDKEVSVLLYEDSYLCSLTFSEDSFKLEMCRSDSLWTGKFVYKK